MASSHGYFPVPWCQPAKFICHTVYGHPNRREYLVTPIVCVILCVHQLGNMFSKIPIVVSSEFNFKWNPPLSTRHGFERNCENPARSWRCGKSRHGHCLWCQFTCTPCWCGILSPQVPGRDIVKPTKWDMVDGVDLLRFLPQGYFTRMT